MWRRPTTTAMKTIHISSLLLLALACGGLPALHASTPPPADAATLTAPKLHTALRELWQGHVAHTRAYALAVKAGDARAAERAAADVVDNAKAIADAVAGFYGKDAGAQLLTLLGGHWGAVKAMTDAQHAGNSQAHAAALQTLTSNAGEIAKFLAAANPYLGEDALRGLLMAHGGHHVAQIGEIMRGDSAAEAQTWKAMQAHMDMIANALADAIAKQFPDKAT